MENLRNSWENVRTGEYRYTIDGSVLILSMGSVKSNSGWEKYCDLSLESSGGECHFCLIHYPEGRSVERFFPYVLVEPEHLPLLDQARGLKGLKPVEQDQLEELVLQTRAFLDNMRFL